MHPISSNKRRLVLFALLSGAIFSVLLFFVILPHMEEENLLDNVEWIESSRFGALDDKVYFLDDDRWEPVLGADPATFAPLAAERGSWRKDDVFGADRNGVYAGTMRLAGLDPQKTRNLGYGYASDGSSAFYGAKPLGSKSPADFQVASGYYAADWDNLYYKGEIVPGAIPSRMVSVKDDEGDEWPDYLKDSRIVWFQGKPIVGADPSSFRIIDVGSDYRYIQYSADKNHFYYQGERLPSVVSETGETIAPGQLRLLMADRDFAGVELFYQGRNVYYFDPADRTLHLFFSRPTGADFIRIAKGLYKDNRNVYFAAIERDWGRNGHLEGATSFFQPIPGVASGSFVKTGGVGAAPVQGDIYRANDRLFLHRPIATDIAAYGDALQEIKSGAAQPIPANDEYRIYRSAGSDESAGSDAPVESAWVAASLGVFMGAAIVSFMIFRVRRRRRRESVAAAKASWGKTLAPGAGLDENARVSPLQPDKRKWPFA